MHLLGCLAKQGVSELPVGWLAIQPDAQQCRKNLWFFERLALWLAFGCDDGASARHSVSQSVSHALVPDLQFLVVLEDLAHVQHARNGF